MEKTPPIVLTIAGFDPSSGAGITADLKTIAAHGCYGVAAITALTVQSSNGVRKVETVNPAMVLEILSELSSDLDIAAIHIGMLGKAAIVDAIVEFLRKQKSERFVLDPVLRSSSGAELLDSAGVDLLVKNLLPLASVITPNIDEAAVLTGLPVTDIKEMKVAAHRLHDMGAKAVVITGGHLDPATDLLTYPGATGIVQREFVSPKQVSRSTHGTGCAFSSAIACQLALGAALADAVGLAKEYVGKTIAHAYPVGHGIGPLNHLYQLDRRIKTKEETT
jgi:hydroxymethylpyrimidine/phosphomethylpyrimidine kinase